jgi:DNA-binding GntR family transcriptional regulator
VNILDLASAPTLAETAYQTVESLIVTLELEPGTVFSEGDLSRALNIGRTPLREALQRLATDGLVSSMPRRGMMVTPINLTDMLSVIEARKVLDRVIMDGAAKNATAENRTAIRNAVVQMEAADATRPREFMVADYLLDRAIWDAAPNQFAVQAARPLHSHCRRFWFKFRNDEDLQRSADLHQSVVDAVLAGDQLAARERSDKLLDYLTLFTKHILIAG